MTICVFVYIYTYIYRYNIHNYIQEYVCELVGIPSALRAENMLIDDVRLFLQVNHTQVGSEFGDAQEPFMVRQLHPFAMECEFCEPLLHALQELSLSFFYIFCSVRQEMSSVPIHIDIHIHYKTYRKILLK